MKKLLILLLMMCLLLCGCSKNEPIVPKACSAVGQAILEGQTFAESMNELTQKKLLKALFLEESDISDCYMNRDASRYTAECILVVTASSEKTLETVKKSLTEYRQSLIDQYRDYQPKEMPKLEASQVMVHGLQCVLVIAPDQPAAKKACEAAW